MRSGGGNGAAPPPESFNPMTSKAFIMENLRQRADEIRLTTFKAISNAGGGHYGGSLSECEILTVLYFKHMNINPQEPEDPGRDRFILSKGHGGPGLYATLALRGYFPASRLDELDKDGSCLPKHIDRTKLVGIDVSCGSLGQGLSIGNGMALAARLDGDALRIYVLMGDGECDEGQVWEAAMTAAKYHLDNITAIVDCNKAQVDGMTENVMPLGDLRQKWSAFGWNVICVDGHDVDLLDRAIADAKRCAGKPTVVLADTVKGKGVRFMEGNYGWHANKCSAEQVVEATRMLASRLESQADKETRHG